MVSASTSVNAGGGPRLRRRVSPRICRTASSITQYSQTRRRSRSMDSPPQGSEALKNVPHRPFPRGRLVEVIQSPSLNPWETRGSGTFVSYVVTGPGGDVRRRDAPPPRGAAGGLLGTQRGEGRGGPDLAAILTRGRACAGRRRRW